MVVFARVIAVATAVFVTASTASAQVSAAEAERIRMRQQITLMETVLEQAISFGAEKVTIQVRRVVQDKPRLGPGGRVSGVRLPGYGVVFHVQVPEMILPITYHVVVREQQDRDVWLRLQQMRNEISGMPLGGERNQRLEEVNRLEQQFLLGNLRPAVPSRGQIGPQSLVPAVPAGVIPAVPSSGDSMVLDDPERVYTREVMAALIDAMLNQSQALDLKADEWLTVYAEDSTPNNPQSPVDAIDSTTQVMKVKGSTLAAFRAQTISIEEARKQVEITEQ
jgi:hypothetical protein